MSASEPRLSRRGFLIGGAAAGYALAAGPVSAAAIRTDEEGLVVGSAEVPVPGAPMPVYFARPEGAGASPTVLVVHEIFGVHEYIRDVCRRLAKQGYLALAPDLYRRQGDVSKLTEIQEIISKVVMKVDDAQVLGDLDAGLAWAGTNGGDATRAAITGFCWGGRIVWLYAAHGAGLRAGAAWYGRLAGQPRPETPEHPLDVAGKLGAPVLGLYGSEDSAIPLEGVYAMRARLSEAGNGSEIVVFPGAPHGFHADYRPSYRELAAHEGWRRMLAWFRDHGA